MESFIEVNVRIVLEDEKEKKTSCNIKIEGSKAPGYMISNLYDSLDQAKEELEKDYPEVIKNHKLVKRILKFCEEVEEENEEEKMEDTNE